MKYVTLFAVAGLILTVTATAGATSVSTFNIGQADFSLYGFSQGGPPLGAPTAGPTYLDITSVVGTYNLDIPPAGGLYDVYISGSLRADFNKDGITDATADFDEYVGNYASPGPSTSWGLTVLNLGNVDVDPYTFDPDGPGPLPAITLGGYTINNMTLSYDVDVDPTTPPNFGPNAYASFVIGGDNLAATLNYDLTGLDNFGGGGDGVMDGWLGGDITVTAIPEPLTMLAVGMGIAGLAGYIRKRNVPRGRKLA